ncbi:hypothetical protein [Acidovorax sp.]|jgi:hypothetical protein|uniref:hypothetical protein n=1 Tax=Acidovorax sp. TaxID=1872122 RepID=UPI00391F580D
MTSSAPPRADAPAPPHVPAPRSHALRWAAWLAAVLACLAVFGMYTVPEFMVMLADQLWACF